MSAAVILGGAGLCWRQFSQYGRPVTRPVNRHSVDPTSTTVVSKTEPTTSFESHYNSMPYSGKTFAHKRNRRHLPTRKPSTSTAPESGVIKKKLFDFSCAKERDDLSFANVLRNIADSLNGPMGKIGEEWQIIYNYNILKKGCPKASDKEYLLNTLHYIDLVTNKIVALFPNFSPLIILQNLIPPVLKSIADNVDGKPIDANLIIEINSQLLSLPLLFSSSLDLHGRNMLTKERDGIGKNIIPEKIELKRGDAYVSIYGGQHKMMRDTDGVCIYDMDIKSLQLSKKHISYIRNHKKWIVTKSTKVMQPEVENGEAELIKSIKLITYVRNEAKKSEKNGSSIDFITEIMAKAGLLKRDELDFIKNKITHSSYDFSYMRDLVEISEESQLLKVKEGQLVIFTDTKEGSINIQHLMLSTGNGLFAGINNDRISSEFNAGNNIITAEQLGKFSNKKLITREGKEFNLHAGFLKRSEIKFHNDYKEAALNLQGRNYQSDSAYAVASVLSMTGDLSSEFISILDESIKNKIPLRKFINSKKEWLSHEQLTKNVPVGGIIFLTNRPEGGYEKGTFALRVNEDEFFIPKLYHSKIITGGTSTIYKTSALKESIQELGLMASQAEFNVAGTRTQALLGRSSRFYAVDNVLYLRAHGLPMTVNYMSPAEIVSIINGLAINKSIDLKRISTIVLESCFGATGFPSTGKSISSLMGKKVIAYRGKYRTGNGAEETNRVIYTPTPLNHLEKMIADITERNIDFIRKLRGVYAYFEHTEVEPIPPTAYRIKRSDLYFNLLIMDMGRLVFGKKDKDNFIEDNPYYFKNSKKNPKHLFNNILIYKPKSSLEFFELCMHIIFTSPEASRHLDIYLSKKNTIRDDEDSSPFIHTTIPVEKDNMVSFLKKSISADLASLSQALGISEINKYLRAKKWSDFGFPGDIYWDDKKNRFFSLKYAGVPSNHCWYYPDDALDDDNWLEAGRNPGTLEQPKYWSEYGKSGSIYYEQGYGYLMLKKDGRPSDHDWYFPEIGEYSNSWEFITKRAGSFETPLMWSDNGISGSVYYYDENKSFYVLKNTGNPSDNKWHFPCAGMVNKNWIYAGKNKGTLDSPKKWNEYGKVGSIYYEAELGYLSLKTEGNPSDDNWYFPDNGQSNVQWRYVSGEVGSFSTPKLRNTEGTAGEVYYAVKEKSFYILRKDGKPTSHGWYYPAPGGDNENWFYAGQNSGTQKSPKKWNEYGKVGSVYYDKECGYVSLKFDGRPSDHSWFFPNNDEPNEYWNLVAYATGSFDSPKIQNDTGKPGDVYFSVEHEAFYILRKKARPYGQRWIFPPVGKDNENWLYGGKNSGTLNAPKIWSEYGKVGSVYYHKNYGYLILKTVGNPAENKWYFPKNGHSDDRWKFVSLKAGTFSAPKRQHAEGIAGEVYYSDVNQAFYILKKSGNPFNCSWKFPYDDDGNWIYAGENRGTPDAPKLWSEYGKIGSVYYDAKCGYLTLKNEGRPSDKNWLYPEAGESNEYWNFISREVGSFIAPKKENATGLAGEVYYSDNNELFYILKTSGNPLINGWYFPYGKADNQNWLYAGKNEGTIEYPKGWGEYGRIGSIYYMSDNGYFILQTEGHPADNKWYFPEKGKSNYHWRFICKDKGTFFAPKQKNVSGVAGDVYYSVENKDYYILKNPGRPPMNGWVFPFDDDENWIVAGKNKGTADSPKEWNEYGKVGSVYYDNNYGFLTLKTEGRPSVNKWAFPDPGQSNQYWNFVSFIAGSFTAPKYHSEKGMAGDVYYSHDQKCFFVFKNENTPSTHNHPFPLDGKSNESWIFAGKNNGTLESPKSWHEYGKPGLIYYKLGFGYLMLKTEGNPSENSWYFPVNVTSDDHWIYIKR
ncbi:Toxin A [Erwinia piriflorinigrans CFBP 5888]|uniref:Toxin A n=2 Tax=Erwinia piriflorinigrans TaxID=665097 RepID=V5Z2Y6_9GAMM|nr:Toxin A [Erwinia piriflorinigrans CFBP 5888]